MTPTPTGSTLGDFETLTRREARPFSHSTTIRGVHDPGLRAALDVFSVVATEPLSALRGFVRTNDRPSRPIFDDAWNGVPETIMSLPLGDGDFDTVRLLMSTSDLRLDVERFELPTRRIGFGGATDAVRTIDDLKVRLGLPMVDVLKAAGVGKSTFYSWRDHDESNPRISSQGRLWMLAQFVEDIEPLVQVPLVSWLAAQDHRLGLLRAGSFDQLLEEVRVPSSDGASQPEYAGIYAVGAEAMSAGEVAQRPRERRGTVSRASSVARRRRME
jgi:hypothetical protein